MKVIGKDRTSCDVCNPIDEILARLDALERRASAIVAKVQGIAPDGEGNVTLPTSSSDTDPLHGRIDAFAMSSEVKEAADDAHAYAASIADDVVVINSEIDALNQAIAALESTVATYGTRLTAVEDADTQNVKLSGDQNISGIKTVPTEATGTRSQQIANSAKVGAELDAYDQMVRTTGNQMIGGEKTFTGFLIHPFQKRDFAISQSSNTPWAKLIEYPTSRRQIRGRIESTSGKAFFIVDNNSNTSPTVRIGGWGVPADSVAFTFNDGDSKVGLWFKASNYESIKIYIDDIGNYSGSDTWPYLTIVSPLEYKALPVGDHITYSSAWAVVQ